MGLRRTISTKDYPPQKNSELEVVNEPSSFSELISYFSGDKLRKRENILFLMYALIIHFPTGLSTPLEIAHQ